MNEKIEQLEVRIEELERLVKELETELTITRNQISHIVFMHTPLI